MRDDPAHHWSGSQQARPISSHLAFRDWGKHYTPRLLRVQWLVGACAKKRKKFQKPKKWGLRKTWRLKRWCMYYVLPVIKIQKRRAVRKGIRGLFVEAEQYGRGPARNNAHRAQFCSVCSVMMPQPLAFHHNLQFIASFVCLFLKGVVLFPLLTDHFNTHYRTKNIRTIRRKDRKALSRVRTWMNTLVLSEIPRFHPRSTASSNQPQFS